MENLLNPSIWIELLTLVILEIILGIDNIIFIAILSNKLSTKYHNKARIIGLTSALLIRLTILILISWLINLTNKLLKLGDFILSSKNIILIFGGLFLLFNILTELNKRLNNKKTIKISKKKYEKFWIIVIQIIFVDTIFSLDTIITAVGIINNIPIIILSFIITMPIMLFASKQLINILNKNQKIMLLCLSILLLISFSLIAEGLNLYVNKGYLYSAISFSILIEIFNQIAISNLKKK